MRVNGQWRKHNFKPFFKKIKRESERNVEVTVEDKYNSVETDPAISEKKVREEAKIKNRHNQVPHLTQDTICKSKVSL